MVTQLRELGAAIEVCPRQDGDPPGDPCVHRFREAVAAGAVPFSCQGPDNGLTIDGGRTLGYEIADAATGLDDVVVQVGGGALASVARRDSSRRSALGRLDAMPSDPRRAGCRARADGASLAAPPAAVRAATAMS